MKEKVFLVSGGSSGIGLKICMDIESLGHRVISLSRSKDKIQRILDLHPGLDEKIRFIQGDISNISDCQKVSDFIAKEYGVLHGLVNNAGVLTKGSMETMDFDQWKYTLDVNLNGPYYLTKTLLPLLKNAGSASVVNISSVAALKPGTSVAYSVSKAGLDMLTSFLAGDLGPYGIRVNSVNPGLVRTNIHLDNRVVADEQAYEAMLEKSRPRYPIGRIGEASDVASMVLFLLSEDASWITGSIIKVDGGVMVENDLIPPKK